MCQKKGTFPDRSALSCDLIHSRANVGAATSTSRLLVPAGLPNQAGCPPVVVQFDEAAARQQGSTLPIAYSASLPHDDDASDFTASEEEEDASSSDDDILLTDLIVHEEGLTASPGT